MAVASSGVVAEFVGSLAKNGSASGNNSDPTSSWKSDVSSMLGSLNGFAYTTASGWAGSGSASDPYRLVFDGANDYVDCGNQGIATSKVFSYETWFNFTTASSGNNVISEGNASTSNTLTQIAAGYSGNTGGVRFFLRDETSTSAAVNSTSTTLNDGNWHHVVGTCDGSSMHLYIDGTDQGSPVAPPSGTLTITQTRIGVRGYQTPTAYFFPGNLATVRFYNRALSAAEVSANYNAGVLAHVTSTSTAPAVFVALLDAAKGVNLSGFSPTVTQYPAPPLNPLTSDALVWTGAQRGGREGGQRAMTTNTWTTDNSKWDRLESYLIVGQAIAMRSFTSDEAAQANNAQIRAYAIAAQVESWVRANRTAGGALEIEMEKMELALSNATVSSTNYKVATVTVNLRVHALI